MKLPLKALVSLIVLLLLFSAAPIVAQEMANLPQGGALAQQSLRPYWHVFIAYAIAIVAVLGWVISIARRLAGLEARLNADG